MAKYYLDPNGVRILVRNFNNSLATKADKAELETYASKQYVDDAIRNADVELPENLSDRITALEGAVTGIYHFKGSVADRDALGEIANPSIGDVYNVAADGMNVAWTEDGWDDFGSTIDLSDYMLYEDVDAISREELNSILFGGRSSVVASAEDFAAVLANNEAEVEITLAEPMSNTAAITIPTGKRVILNLGGKAISNTSTPAIVVNGGDLVIKNGTISTSTAHTNAIEVANGGRLEVDGASVSSAKNQAINVSGGSVLVKSGTITGQESGIAFFDESSVMINGGTIIGVDNGALMGNGSTGRGGATVVMNGGRLEGHIQSADYIACAVYMPNTGSFTMNAGTIVSDGCGICMRGGTVNLNGGSIVASGATGVKGKVGDSRVVVGPYAVVYDANSRYPAMDSLELNIANGVVLSGTDGDIDVLLDSGITANITDNRT